MECNIRLYIHFPLHWQPSRFRHIEIQFWIKWLWGNIFMLWLCNEPIEREIPVNHSWIWNPIATVLKERWHTEPLFLMSISTMSNITKLCFQTIFIKCLRGFLLVFNEILLHEVCLFIVLFLDSVTLSYGGGGNVYIILTKPWNWMNFF